MSLILEALKKSEANRRLGAAPDLATPFSPARPARSSLPWLVAAILVSGVVGWWWLHSSAPTPPATPPAAAISKPAKPIATQAAPRRTAPQHPSRAPGNPPAPPNVQPMMQSPVAGPVGARGNFGAERQSMRERMAARNANAGSEVRLAPAHTTEHPAAVAPAPSRAPKTADTRGYTPPPAIHAAAAPTAPPPVVAPPATPPPAAAHSAPPVAGNPASAAPPTSAPPSAADTPPITPYYALAFAVRKALPQLKLSMHVYSVDPKNRFVILNDTRMVEGDTTPDGILLHEIQPDGVILDFKGQRFFFPRDGL